eukprot:1209723-Rhodomonas_salina.1
MFSTASVSTPPPLSEIRPRTPLSPTTGIELLAQRPASMQDAPGLQNRHHSALCTTGSGL